MLKTKRGITLVALVVTIIILLILAGVAINVTFNQEELFGKANNTVEKWNNKVVVEEGLINTILEELSGGDEIEITDNVEFSGIPTSWTQESITVTITHPNIPEGYEIQYKLGEGEWTTGESVVVEQNVIIYGRLYNATIDDAAAEATKNITNIDKTSPTAPTGIESSATSNSITVQANGGTDGESGVAGYQYRINNGNWSETKANGESQIFSELVAVTQYTIYARTVNKAGGVSNEYSIIKETTVPIPAGYTASQIEGENTIESGLVIYQTTIPVIGTKNSTVHINAMQTYNQYVWVPVDDINDMVMCSSNSGNSVCSIGLEDDEATGVKVLKCTNPDHSETATDLVGRLYYGSITNTTDSDGNKIYSYKMEFTNEEGDPIRNQTYTQGSNYHEPNDVRDTSYGDASRTGINIIKELLGNRTATSYKEIRGEWRNLLKEDFRLMATSVAKYGGFYISRYEIGRETIDGENVVTSKKGHKILTTDYSDKSDYLGGNRWYGLYNIIRNSGENKQMIWGCQYDQVIKFLKEEGEDPENGHSDRNLTTTHALSGQNELDCMLNIYDLEGNHSECTAEAINKNCRVVRGSTYGFANTGTFEPVSFRNGLFPINGDNTASSRASLYL